MSIRQAAPEFGLSRKAIREMLQFSLPERLPQRETSAPIPPTIAPG
jgi:hypothetical protein